jgi:hypothetical protein
LGSRLPAPLAVISQQVVVVCVLAQAWKMSAAVAQRLTWLEVLVGRLRKRFGSATRPGGPGRRVRRSWPWFHGAALRSARFRPARLDDQIAARLQLLVSWSESCAE